MSQEDMLGGADCQTTTQAIALRTSSNESRKRYHLLSVLSERSALRDMQWHYASMKKAVLLLRLSQTQGHDHKRRQWT